jgi:hypothetical protein
LSHKQAAEAAHQLEQQKKEAEAVCQQEELL